MTDYTMIAKQIRALAEISAKWLPLFSNASALLYEAMEQVNWAGFYLADGDALLLGPFQGKPACVRIEKGRGVCGAAFREDAVQLVPDVHAFPGHIACDSASNSAGWPPCWISTARCWGGSAKRTAKGWRRSWPCWRSWPSGERRSFEIHL